MEDFKRRSAVETNEKEIVYSQSVKAGKRIYYLDVKKNRKDELFLAITESKKIVNGEGEDAQVSYEKHKIFLYKEDFDKFANSLNEAIAFIKKRQPYEAPAPVAEATETLEAEREASELNEEFKIDIDF